MIRQSILLPWIQLKKWKFSLNLVESIAEPTAAGKDVEALERLDRRQGGGRRPAQDDVDDNYYEDIHVGHDGDDYM